MNNSEFISKIQNLIARNKIKETIQELIQFLENKDFELLNAALIISNKFFELKLNTLKGIYSIDEIGRIKSKILNSILMLLDEIKSLPEKEEGLMIKYEQLRLEINDLIIETKVYLASNSKTSIKDTNEFWKLIYDDTIAIHKFREELKKRHKD